MRKCTYCGRRGSYVYFLNGGGHQFFCLQHFHRYFQDEHHAKRLPLGVLKKRYWWASDKSVKTG